MSRDKVLLGLGLLGVVSLLVACGGSVVEGTPPGEEGGAAGSAGAGGSHAGAGGSHAGGSPGYGGWAGAAGGVAGAAGYAGSIDGGVAGAAGADGGSCAQTNEQFSLKAQIYDGKTIGCGIGNTNGVFEIQGVVTQSTGNSFELDSCPPNADCMQMLSTFSFEAPNLYAYIPQSAFVKIRVNVSQPWGCIQQVEITNLPNWGGVQSPYGTQETIWLSASDGDASTVPGSIISVFKIPQGCTNGDPPGCGGDPPDMYALAFGAIWQSSIGESVYMGTQAMWTLHDNKGDQWLMARNLRSYSSGACDDYFNWGFWVTQAVWAEDTNP